MRRSRIARDSSEYAELLAEVFAETVQKAAGELMCCEHSNEEVTPALMECLQYVYLHGPSTIGEIARGLEVTLSAGSQLVERLVRKGLVTRREDEEDRRLIHVELTADGEKLVKQMRRRRSSWFESVIGGMNVEERGSLLDGLEGFLKVALAKRDDVDHACIRCGREHFPFCVVGEVMTRRAET